MSTAQQQQQTRGAIPRGLDASYRGWLSEKPRTVTANGRELVRARIGVNMAAPDVPQDERTELTEWVNILATRQSVKERLLACDKGDLIAVMGNVTKKFYKRADGEVIIDRTIFADAALSAAISISGSSQREETGAAGAEDDDTRDEHGVPRID